MAQRVQKRNYIRATSTPWHVLLIVLLAVACMGQLWFLVGVHESNHLSFSRVSAPQTPVSASSSSNARIILGEASNEGKRKHFSGFRYRKTSLVAEKTSGLPSNVVESLATKQPQVKPSDDSQLPLARPNRSLPGDGTKSICSAKGLTEHERLTPRLPPHEDAHCYGHYDFGMLDEWMKAGTAFCLPRESSSFPSSLTCRVTVDAHLPGPTGPHTLCDGRNVLLNTQQMGTTSCPVHRPGYKCDGPPVFVSYRAAALAGACTRTAPFTIEAFPRDHLRDMFDSFEADVAESLVEKAVEAEAPVTLLITRERGEHANLFHATTDWINAFMTLHAAGVINGKDPATNRRGMETVQVLLMDTQEGPFDEAIYKHVLSPLYPVLRIPALQASGVANLRLPHALFVPPGYTNFFLANVASESTCHSVSGLMRSFRTFVLGGLGLPVLQNRRELNPDRPLVITFVSRRPYTKFVAHSFVGRQIENEEEIAAAISALSGVIVQKHDFAQGTFAQQVATMSRTDVLIGMHGAALTAAVYMPDHAAVLELWPKDSDMWRVFEHISAYSGLGYFRWANRDPSAFHTDDRGDYTKVDVHTFMPMFEEAVSHVRSRLGALRDVAALQKGTATSTVDDMVQPCDESDSPTVLYETNEKEGAGLVHTSTADVYLLPGSGKNAFVFTMDSISKWIQASHAGGPAGERIVREGLTASLQALGYNVHTADSDEQMELMTENGKGEKFDLFFFDQWTVQGRDLRPRAYLAGRESNLYILAFFGWNPAPLLPLLHHNHVLTAFPPSPGHEFERNTFLGFVQPPPPNPTPHHPSAEMGNGHSIGTSTDMRRIDGVVWAKKAEYLLDCVDLLGKLLTDPRSPVGMRLHFVLDPSAATVLSPLALSADELSRTVWHGHMKAEEWHAMLRSAAFLIGLGNPLLGPSALDALAAGAVYIDPDYVGKIQPSDPKYASLGSQHPYLRSAVSMPHVCGTDLGRIESVLACVRHAIDVTNNGTAAWGPLLLPAFSQASVTQRLDALLHR